MLLHRREEGVHVEVDDLAQRWVPRNRRRARDSPSKEGGRLDGPRSIAYHTKAPSRAQSGFMSLTKLVRIRSSDRKVLAFLGPVFALVTASNVVTISFAKALFLAHNPPEALPWMYISAAVFTMILAFSYVAISGGSDAGKRLRSMLALASVSFVGLGALSGTDPAEYSLLIFAWSTGIGQLVMIQSWTWSGNCVPTRQARRLFPMFSALATAGATAGGLLTKALIKDVGLVGLLFIAVLLLLGAMIVVHWTPDLEDEDQGADAASDAPKESAIKRIPVAIAAIRKTPLLARIAALVFLVQAASVILDYQFSAAIQDHFDQKSDEMAGFIGVYYAVSNTVTFLVAFMATGKLSRVLGIGLSSASAAIVLGIGGAVSMSLGFFGAGSVFWSIASTSFGERIVGFAVAKQALQAAVMPLDKRLAEAARFLIDGVVSRVAVVVVSVIFLLLGAAIADYTVLSPVLLVVSILAVIVGMRLGPAYERALLDALKDRKLAIGTELPDWARSEASNIVSSGLRSQDMEEVERGLLIAKEMKIPLTDGDARRLLEEAPPAIVVTTLEVMQDQEMLPDLATMRGLLDNRRPVDVVCAMLRILPQGQEELASEVERLSNHDSDAVSAYAINWLRSSQVNTHGRARLGKRVSAMTDGGGDDGPSTRQMAAIMDTDILAYEEGQKKGPTTLSARYVHLVDRIPSLMRSDDEQMRRLAMDMLVDLSLPEHVAMLFEALDDPRARALAMMALARMPEESVLQRLYEGLVGEAGGDTNDKVRLVVLAERVGGEAAANLVEGQMEVESLAVRDQAVKSMWRMCADNDAIAPDRGAVTLLVQGEVERLVNYAVLDGALSTRKGSRQALLAAEVRLLRGRAEKRLFRLLGLVFPREPIERAWVHYRNPDRRIRSNAIELLDTTIDDADLRVVVSYAESTGYQSGRSQTTGAGLMAIPAFTRAMSMMADTSEDGGPIDALLQQTDPWLRELHGYALSADRSDENSEGGPMPSSHDDVMEKLFLLRGVELFNQVPADQLLPLAELAVRKAYPAGEVIFNADDPGDQLYVVVSGEVIIERDGQTVATLARGHAFGEMAILDDAPRSATVRVDQATECLLVGHDDFGELLDIAPGLARGVMRVLTMRLRSTLERLNS
jgi:hypothetical protein